MNEWMNEWTDRQTGRQIDRQTDKRKLNFLFLVQKTETHRCS